jgi:hypothetical protein
MGYFRGLAEASFKDSIDGHKLFYPWGIFGKGYVLPSPAHYEKLRDFLTRMYMGVLPLIVVTVCVDMRLNLGLLALYCLWYWWFAKSQTADLKVSPEKLKISESTANSARGHNLGVLLVLLVVSILFVLAGLAMLPTAPFLGILSITFFGLCSFMIFRMARIKWRDRRSG